MAANIAHEKGKYLTDSECLESVLFIMKLNEVLVGNCENNFLFL